MGLLIPFDPAALTPATAAAFDELIASLQTWAGKSVDATGKWQDVAYFSGDYTQSTGTWTVDQGDQDTYRYAIVGDIMIINVRLVDTSTTAAIPELRIRIPEGYNIDVFGANVTAGVLSWDGSAASGTGIIGLGASTTTDGTANMLRLARDYDATVWPTEAQALDIGFTVMVPVKPV